MSTLSLLDAAGRRRSPATMPGYLCGRAPKNKGMRFPADPPRVEEIIAVMRMAGDSAHGLRVRALVAVLWRAGLRISEALALTESDVDPRRGSVLVRRGKGEKRREAGMDDWGFDHLARWLERRVELPVGPPFCVIDGSTRDRSWSATAVRAELRRLAAEAGGPAPLRSAPAAPRACRRARPRGHCGEPDPASARAHRPGGPPRHTFKASTQPRSSAPCTRAARR